MLSSAVMATSSLNRRYMQGAQKAEDRKKFATGDAGRVSAHPRRHAEPAESTQKVHFQGYVHSAGSQSIQARKAAR